VDEVITAEQQLVTALSELRDELGDINFEALVFDLNLNEQFQRVLSELFGALTASGDAALQEAAAILDNLLGIALDTEDARDKALDAIRAFVTAMGEDVPDTVKTAVRALLGILESLAREAPRATAAVADPAAEALRRQLQAVDRMRRLLSRDRAAVQSELARLNRGLPGSAVGVQQSVSITGVQANELLSVTRTNAHDNRLNRLANERAELVLIELAHAVGGDLLVQRISERLGSQYTDQLARQGVAA
jgi:hypothetical protein